MFSASMRALAVGGVCLVIQGAVRAAIVNPQDSSTFTYKYEGDAFTVDQDGMTGSGFGNTGYSGIVASTGISASSDGDIFNYSTDLAFGGNLESSVWPTVATHEAGWTWESRLRVNSTIANWAMLLRIGPAANNTTTNQHEIFYLTKTGIYGLGSGQTIPMQADVFHTLRIAQAANSSEFNVWLDGQFETAFTFADNAGFGDGANHWFGDGSGSGGGDIDFDYIRFTAGGYSPAAVPEPAALSLLSLGTLTMLRRQRA